MIFLMESGIELDARKILGGAWGGKEPFLKISGYFEERPGRVLDRSNIIGISNKFLKNCKVTSL